MRLFQWVFLTVMAVSIMAWSAEDQEILKVNYELQNDYPGMTFYEFMKLEKGPKSSLKEINKQFKKLSVKFHPDKAKGKKAKKIAQKNFERLSLVMNILKNSSKDRYDFFLKNGFPKYKNNRFLYERFKPGLIFTFVFLFIIIGVAHYIILRISTSQDRKRIENLIDQIKTFANKQSSGGVLTEQRKVRIDGIDKSFLVRIDGVFMIDEDDENQLTRMTADDIKPPTIRDSLLVRFPVFLWNNSIGKISEKLVIDLTRPEEPSVGEVNSFENGQKKKVKKPQGEKLVLPNGKIVYGKKKK